MKTLAALSVLALSGVAVANFDLQITEMWPGNEPGENLTEDWFEITNFGTMPWTIADGSLYFDDESADIADGALMEGISTIAPGETVIFVDEGPAATVGWNDAWFTNLPAGTQVGYYDGKGLGQGGDGVTLFFDAGDAGLDAGDQIDFETYPDANLNGGQSWDVVLGAFSTVGNASGAYQTFAPNDVGQFGIGSPGSIPSPGAIALMGLAGAAGFRRRRA